MKADLAKFLRSLDWTRPCIPLLDDVEAWLIDNRPALSTEDCGDMADRLVMSRLS